MPKDSPMIVLGKKKRAETILAHPDRYSDADRAWADALLAGPVASPDVPPTEPAGEPAPVPEPAARRAAKRRTKS